MVENGAFFLARVKSEKVYRKRLHLRREKWAGRLWMAGDGNMRESGICSTNNKEREVAMSGLCTGSQGDRGEQGMGRWEWPFAVLIPGDS